MNNKDFVRGIILGAAVASAVFLGGWFGGYLAVPSHDGVLSNPEYVQKLEYLEDIIDEEYLNEKDEAKLAEGLYTGLLYGLGDPYSRYYTAEEYAEENTSTEGAYVGIGVVLQENRGGGVEIAECYEGGPGEQAGLIAGDIISQIDGTDVMDAELSDVAAMIKNSSAEETVLTIYREGMDTPLEITIPITDVELPSVFSEMLDDQAGYIRISQFTGVTYEQYKEAFGDLEKQGMKRLVIDLRDNPGGLLSSVCDVLGEILPEGLIVYTEDKYGEREEIRCDGENPISIPMAVLVNEGSASASEIFAGAVQDYGVGAIVGTTTYGKGVVQSITALDDGSAVKLTISNYYTPNGNSIQGIGIQPDVEVDLDASLLNLDEIPHDEDNQLRMALQVLEDDNQD